MTERSTDGLEFQAISRNGESLMLPPFIHLVHPSPISARNQILLWFGSSPGGS
jgi:hypothetical protein